MPGSDSIFIFSDEGGFISFHQVFIHVYFIFIHYMDYMQYVEFQLQLRQFLVQNREILLRLWFKVLPKKCKSHRSGWE